MEFLDGFSIALEKSEVKWKIAELGVKNGRNRFLYFAVFRQKDTRKRGNTSAFCDSEFSELKNQTGRVIMAKALRNGDRT